MFKTIKSKKKFEVVLEQIKNLLISGKLKIGQKLPNEIELSESMGISRSSLREAFKVLSVLGIIEGKSGEGTIIKQANPENLRSIMSLVAVSKGLDTNELYEVRSILEAEAASLAAIRRSNEELSEVRDILLEMDEHFITEDAEASSHTDYLFHQSIVKLSNNRMLVMLMEVFADLQGEHIRNTRSKLATSTEVLKRFQEQHWAIYYAIEDGDGNKAKSLMFEHFKYAQDELKLRDEI